MKTIKIILEDTDADNLRISRTLLWDEYLKYAHGSGVLLDDTIQGMDRELAYKFAEMKKGMIK